jgi:hypothetical protein
VLADPEHPAPATRAADHGGAAQGGHDRGDAAERHQQAEELRSSAPSATSAMTARPTTTPAAPLNPMTKRTATRTPRDGASAHSAVAAVHRADQDRGVRRPYRSESGPGTGWPAAMPSRKEGERGLYTGRPTMGAVQGMARIENAWAEIFADSLATLPAAERAALAAAVPALRSLGASLRARRGAGGG